MAEITYKRTGEFIRKLFEILMEYPEGLQAGEALEKLAGLVALTPYGQLRKFWRPKVR